MPGVVDWRVVIALCCALAACGGRSRSDSSQTGGAANGGSPELSGGAMSRGGADGGSLSGGSADGGSPSGGAANGGVTNAGATSGGSLSGGTADGGEPSLGGNDAGGAGSDPDAVEYSACTYLGDLDHIFIAKYDRSTNLCVAMHFLSPPGTNPSPGLRLPDRYSFEGASATYPADGICKLRGGTDPGVISYTATGFADWRMGSGLPIVGVSIDAYVVFDAPIPTPQHLQASGLGASFCQ